MSAHQLDIACAVTLILCIIVAGLCMYVIWREGRRMEAMEAKLRRERERRMAKVRG